MSVYGEPVDGDFLFDSVGTRILGANIHLARDGFYIRDTFGPGTHYIRVGTYVDVTSHPIPYTIHALKDASYTKFIEECQAATSAINSPQIDDPLYGCQWHLRNTTGEDINVEPVWVDDIRGEGINIAVVDDGMDFSHIDLRDNVSTPLNHSYTDTESIFNPFTHHGTQVAGVVAARDNGVGVRGVAPRATIYGYNYLASSGTDAQRSDAMTRNAALTAVSNNSWGHVDGPGLSNAGFLWERAVDFGVSKGYGGKGTFYSWATGNGRLKGDDSNLDELTNYYGVTAVCAVNDGDVRASYSEFGANLWVCAPSGESTRVENREIVTTENHDRYVYDFSGTSAATPIVSGVAALMRQANPNLTWRDLKLILAASARKNDPANADWEDGALKYGSTSATDRYSFNHEYGFGVVDAKAAVDLAKGWTNAPPSISATAASSNLNVPIPDATTTGPLTTVTHNLTLNTDINFTEFVEIDVTFNHPSFRDLDITLVSPSGAESQMTLPFDTYTPDDPTDEDFIPLRGSFRLGSARHLGENPNGAWQLRVTDRVTIASGTFQSWSITVYGHTVGARDQSACATQGAVANASTNPALVSDCEILLEARDTLVGTGTSLNWSASMPMTSWDGVTVEGTPARVTRLSLWNKGLRGSIPAKVDDLTALRVLDLGIVLEVCEGAICRESEESERNLLTGTIPASLGNLVNLESLSLSRNQLTGPIPAQLSSLSGLRLLALGGNQLTGAVPPQLGELTNLDGLYLRGNQLTGQVPPELGNLERLKWMDLESNQLSGGVPATLGNLANLERLTLHENHLSGPLPSDLGNLSNLKHLSLWDNQLSGQLPVELGSLSNLEQLRLSQNQLTGDIPKSLGDLSNLRELSLWRNQLTGMIPNSLVRLSTLEKLYLSQNQFTGCVPEGLEHVPDNDLASVGLPFCVSPSVMLINTSPGVPVRINNPIPVTATFSEPVSGFEMADITVANGIVSNFAGSNGDSVHIFDVIPNTIGVVTVDIAENVAVDAEGSGNSAGVQLHLGMPYDDDIDGTINGIEVLNGVRDYFIGILTGQQILELVRLYFSSPG